jgi:hypothetical protein
MLYVNLAVHCAADTCELCSNGDVFLSRMEAQRNARDFSGTLIWREQQLDTHVITALDGMTDAEYKQLQLRRGYSIHGHRYLALLQLNSVSLLQYMLAGVSYAALFVHHCAVSTKCDYRVS